MKTRSKNSSDDVQSIERLLMDIVETGKNLNTNSDDATIEFDVRGARRVSTKQRRLFTTLLKVGATTAGAAAIALAFKNNRVIRAEFKKILRASIDLLPEKVRVGTMALYQKVKGAFPFLATWLPYVLPGGGAKAQDPIKPGVPPGFTERVWKILLSATSKSALVVAKYLSNPVYWYTYPLILAYEGGKATYKGGRYLVAVFTHVETGKEVMVDIHDLPRSTIDALLHFQKTVFGQR